MSADKKRGLGRGFASLIPDGALDGAASVAEDRPQLRVVPVEELRPSPVQPRDRFDVTQLDTLTASVRAHGILQPIVVRREAGHYVIIAGERRYRAAMAAGLREVPVVLREAATAAEQLELGLVENLQRADLDPIEAARGYARLIEEFGYTQATVAERIGKERATVANAIRLLKLPDLALDAIRDGKITAGHGRALLAVSADRDLRRLLARTIEEGLSVRALEQLIAREQRASNRQEPARGDADDHAPLMRRLSDLFHARVTIQPRADGGGRLTIDYADDEHLDAILQLVEPR